MTHTDYLVCDIRESAIISHFMESRR